MKMSLKNFLDIRWEPFRRGICGALIIAGLVLAVACSGDDTSATSSELCIEFSAEQSPAAGQVVSRLSVDSVCEVAAIEIVATGPITDVYSFETRATYDSSVAYYLGYSKTGSFLESDGVDIVPVIGDDVEGVLTIGVSRNSTVGIDIENTELLITLFFALQASSTASGDFGMDDECLMGSEEPPLSKPGVTCSGGQFVAR